MTRQNSTAQAQGKRPTLQYLSYHSKNTHFVGLKGSLSVLRNYQQMLSTSPDFGGTKKLHNLHFN